MSTWNHRVCKETENEYVNFSIREVYYNSKGEIWAVDENPCHVYCSEDWEEEPLDSLKKTLTWMLGALEKPIVDLDTIKFAEMEE